MNSFEGELKDQLEAIRDAGLYRELRGIDGAQSPHIVSGGKPLLNFSSNDYLGLANHPALQEAAIKAIHDFGTGSGASRLVCGSLEAHHRLEQCLAEFKGVPAALSFSSGYAAALGAIGALVGKEDIIVIDKLVHASIVDAARLSEAKMRVFAHNDIDDLTKILQWADKRRGHQAKERRGRVLIVTESVFSMDGDLAPLREIIELKERHGAWLMVDEAHATGLFGERGRGLAEAFGVGEQIEVQMGTLGKAVGAAGGYICGSRALIELLINRARSFIFSTAPTPAATAAAAEGLRLVRSTEGRERRSLLWQRVDETKNGLIMAGRQLSVVQSPILPLIVGNELKAISLAVALLEDGLLIPAIRYPTVARGAARLRLTLSAAHTSADITQLVKVLGHRHTELPS
jgi:8-amino-7-oxononanoate synthase